MKRAMAQEKSDDKYSRQALIEGWDQRNMNAAVAVAGLGRAGFIVADCMARAGVATLYLVDSADRAGAAKPAIEQVSGAKVYAVAADSQYVRGCSAIVNALQDKNLEEILLRNAAVNKVPVISIRTNGMQGEVLEAGGQMPEARCLLPAAGGERLASESISASTMAAGLAAQEAYKILQKGKIGAPAGHIYFSGSENILTFKPEEIEKYKAQQNGPGRTYSVSGLAAKSATIIGVGGLGTICARDLAQAGIGKLYLVDNDAVEESNLTRQVLFKKEHISMAKTASAKKSLEEIAPNTEVIGVPMMLGAAKSFHPEIFRSDVVLDCLDNVNSRLQLSKFCRKFSVPLVSGGVHALAGQLQHYNPKNPASPCINCNPFISEAKPLGDSCTKDIKTPIINSTTNLIAGMQVQETLKILHGGGIGTPTERFFYFLGDKNTALYVNIKRKQSCTACSAR